MTVIHREYTYKQKYKKLKPLALTPSIELKNSTIKVHSGGQISRAASRRRPDLRQRQTVRVSRSDVIVRGIRDLTTRIKDTLALKRNKRAEAFVKDPPSDSREGLTALREVVDILRRRVDQARDSRRTVVATHPGDVTLRFAEVTSARDSTQEIAHTELKELATQASRNVREEARQSLADLGDTARQQNLQERVINTNVAAHERVVDEFKVVATEVQQNCASLIRNTIATIHETLGNDRTLQTTKTQLKSVIDPVILSINEKINELNNAILASYTSVDNLVSRTKPILDQLKSINAAIGLLNNRISDLNANLSSLSPEANLAPLLQAVSDAKSALDAFRPTAKPPSSTNAKFSILKIIKATFERLTNSIKKSLTIISSHSDKVTSAKQIIGETANNKAKAEQAFSDLNTAVSRLSPSAKEALVRLINEHVNDLANKPALEAQVKVEPRDPTNDVRFPVKPEGMTVKDYQKIINDLMKSYDPVPGKSRQEAPPDLQIDNPQITKLLNELSSAIKDVDNVANALDNAAYNRNIANRITEIAYAIYKNSVLVPTPSHKPIDDAQANLDNTSLRNPETVGRTESGLVRVYSSLTGHYNRLKTIAGFNNPKNTAQRLKAGFNKDGANGPKPNETPKTTATTKLSDALSSRSVLLRDAFNLDLHLGSLTKLKSEIDIVINKLYNSFKSTLENDAARDSSIASKGDAHLKRESSGATKESSMSKATFLANRARENTGSNKERTKLVENLTDLASLTDKSNSMKESLKTLENILKTVNDPVKFQLLSKIKDLMKLKDEVDSSIHEISTKPDGVKDPVDTTREMNARQLAKDKLSDAFTKLDNSTLDLADAMSSYNKHRLEKLSLDKETSGIEPADTTALVAHAEATKKYNELKGLFASLAKQYKEQVKAKQNEPRDPTAFKPDTTKPDTAKPDSTALDSAKGKKSYLEGLVAKFKSLFVKQDLAKKLLEKYADLNASTAAHLESINKNKPDPTNKDNARKAKDEAKRKANELTPETTKRDSYDKNNERLRELNKKLDEALDNINDLQTNKALSIFDKNKLLDDARKMLNDLKRQQNELKDKIKSLEKDIRDIEKELKKPDLDPEKIKQLKELLKELNKLKDELNKKLKDLNDKIRDLRDKMNKLKNENSALKRLKDFLNALKNGLKSVGLNLIPILAGLGLLGAGTLPFIFAAPAIVSTPPAQPKQPTKPREPDNPNDYNSGYNAGLEAGRKAGESQGKTDGLNTVQKEYNEWVKENPEARKRMDFGDGSTEENGNSEAPNKANANQNANQGPAVNNSNSNQKVPNKTEPDPASNNVNSARNNNASPNNAKLRK